jgi:hypothetical protein
MSLATVTLRGDLTGTAFGAALSFTDYTAWLELGGDGAPIDLTWGRQDNRADVPTGMVSFTLNNTDGRFTTGASVIEVDHVFNVRLTANGVTTDRLTGYVTSVEPTWPQGVASWSIVRVSCMDITGKLAVAQPIRSMVEQEMLADLPTYLYPLSESADATNGGDVSGNGNASAQTFASKYGAGAIAFGSDALLFDTPTGAGFSGGTLDGVNVPMSVLRIGGSTGPFIPVYSAHTVGCWIVAPVMTAPARCDILFQGDAGVFSWVSLINGAARYWAYTSTSGASATVTGTGNLFDGRPHYLVGTVDVDRATLKLYVDGLLIGTSVASFGFDFSAIKYNTIGGTISSNVAQEPFLGVVSDVALYPTALSAARVLAHYQAGVGTFTESSGARFARVAGYGKVTTTGLPAGSAMMGGQKTAGRTALEVLTEVARTEGTVTYPTGGNALTFQGRATRYDVAPAVTLVGDDIAPDLPIRKDTQGFFNELTVQRAGGSTQRAINATSQAGKAGRVDGGSFTVAPSTDADALQNANWQVALHSPTGSITRLPSLKIDLITRTAAFQASILALGPSSLINLTTLPSQAPNPSPQLWVEGGHEVIGPNEWYVEFFTSGQTIEGQVWTLDDAGPNGALDGTAVLAF